MRENRQTELNQITEEEMKLVNRTRYCNNTDHPGIDSLLVMLAL